MHAICTNAYSRIPQLEDDDSFQLSVDTKVTLPAI